MNTFKKLIPFRLLIILALFSKVSYSQDNNVMAETHNLLLDNSSKDKTIQIRFHNCTKESYENIYKKALLNSNLSVFNKAYNTENKIASLYFTKNSAINTNDLKTLLLQLGITNIIFNEKKTEVADLNKYHFTEKEKSNNQERIEK